MPERSKQNRNELTDTEKKLMVAKWEGIESGVKKMRKIKKFKLIVIKIVMEYN